MCMYIYTCVFVYFLTHLFIPVFVLFFSCCFEICIGESLMGSGRLHEPYRKPGHRRPKEQLHELGEKPPSMWSQQWRVS